jgi:hypothetical protein
LIFDQYALRRPNRHWYQEQEPKKWPRLPKIGRAIQVIFEVILDTGQIWLSF